jgi:hypothetical protein
MIQASCSGRAAVVDTASTHVDASVQSNIYGHGRAEPRRTERDEIDRYVARRARRRHTDRPQ